MSDRSAELIELPHVTTAFKLYDVLESQPYTYSGTAAVRELAQQADRPEYLLNLAADVIPNVWNTRANVAGLLSTMLSTSATLWRPSEPILEALEKLCDKAIRSGDWSRIASVEPLAFALGAKGRTDIHRRVLERLIEERHWRDADANRIRQYYGAVGVEIAAIVRHWREPIRKGLLRVNDVSRLMDLLLSADHCLLKPSTEHTLLDLLAGHALVLKDCGQAKLASSIDDLLRAFRHKKGNEVRG